MTPNDDREDKDRGELFHKAGHRHHSGGELITLDMVAAVRTDVDKLLATLKAMRFEQERLKQREGRHLRTLKKTEHRIVFWSAVECCTLVAVAFAQVSIVRKFFASNGVHGF